jgi:putative transposase
VIQRGNNRQACFHAGDDYRFYLEWLGSCARETGCSVHAYVLMTNHVHLLVSSLTTEGVGKLMKRLGQRYVQYFNRSYGRSGTLWEGRFRSCLTQEESYVLACYRYIELNPVRAGIVDHPGEYPWSSYRANAQGEESGWLAPHDCYRGLALDDQARQAAYRELFRQRLDPGVVDEIRGATNSNYVLGSARFQDQVSKALGRRVVRGRSGRPRKQLAPETGELFGVEG